VSISQDEKMLENIGINSESTLSNDPLTHVPELLGCEAERDVVGPVIVVLKVHVVPFPSPPV
jgi:hypothetical protein